MRSAILMLLLAVVAFHTRAGDLKDGTFMAQPNISCGKLIEGNKSKGGRHEFSMWLGGFLTAYNWLKPDTVSILGKSDLTSAILWIENYCRANPLQSTGGAAILLTEELYPQRLLSTKDVAK